MDEVMRVLDRVSKLASHNSQAIQMGLADQKEVAETINYMIQELTKAQFWILRKLS